MIINPRSRILFSKIFQGHRNYCQKRFPGESTFGLIKPDGVKHMGAIFDIIHEEGFYLRGLRMTQFSKASAKRFYDEHIDKDFFEPFMEYVISGPVIAMRLGRLDAINHWRKVIGPTDPEVAKEEAPESIRAKFATSERHNCVHGADSEKNAVKEIDFFFNVIVGAKEQKTLMTRIPPVYPNTILMLTPQLLLDGKLGSIVRGIQDAGCEISAMQIFSTDELGDLARRMGTEDAPKVIKRNVTKGNSLLMEVSHPKGYNQLLEEMLRVENIHGTGYTHFDKGDEKLSEKVFI